MSRVTLGFLPATRTRTPEDPHPSSRGFSGQNEPKYIQIGPELIEI